MLLFSNFVTVSIVTWFQSLSKMDRNMKHHIAEVTVDVNVFKVESAQTLESPRTVLFILLRMSSTPLYGGSACLQSYRVENDFLYRTIKCSGWVNCGSDLQGEAASLDDWLDSLWLDSIPALILCFTSCVSWCTEVLTRVLYICSRFR